LFDCLRNLSNADEATRHTVNRADTHVASVEGQGRFRANTLAGLVRSLGDELNLAEDGGRCSRANSCGVREVDSLAHITECGTTRSDQGGRESTTNGGDPGGYCGTIGQEDSSTDIFNVCVESTGLGEATFNGHFFILWVAKKIYVQKSRKILLAILNPPQIYRPELFHCLIFRIHFLRTSNILRNISKNLFC
jgi:hypothetical protein